MNLILFFIFTPVKFNLDQSINLSITVAIILLLLIITLMFYINTKLNVLSDNIKNLKSNNYSQHEELYNQIYTIKGISDSTNENLDSLNLILLNKINNKAEKI